MCVCVCVGVIECWRRRQHFTDLQAHLRCTIFPAEALAAPFTLPACLNVHLDCFGFAYQIHKVTLPALYSVPTLLCVQFVAVAVVSANGKIVYLNAKREFYDGP